MLEFGNKEFRNIQQQVAKNQEDIERGLKGIKISYSVDFSELAGLTTEANYGKYILVSHNGKDYLYVITHRANDGLLADNLGEWPAKIPGAQGPEGPQGPQGERGPAVYGTASSLPQVNDYKLGDFYLLTTGECYKAVLSNGVKTWVLQANYRGPQGPAGDAGDEVQANPGQTTDVLHSIGIDGINYALESELTSADRAMLNNLETNMEWETDGSATFGHDIYADGNIEAGYDVTVGRKLYIDDITKIQDPDGNEIAQGKLTAGDNVSIVNNVISAVSGATTWGAISGTLSNQTDLNTALNSKQSTISDLSTIRSGASAGATAVQPAAITDMATKTWVEGKGYLTQHQSLAAYRTSAAQDIIDQNIREVAEGKCNSFVVNATGTNFNSTNVSVTVTSFTDVDGNTVITSNLNKGDIVWTTEQGVLDRWLSDPATGTWLILDAQAPDLSNFYTKSQADNTFQAKLTAGSNVSISGNTISAVDTKYSAGTNVSISGSNVISATDTTYSAGTGLTLSGTTFSANTSVLATKTYVDGKHLYQHNIFISKTSGGYAKITLQIMSNSSTQFTFSSLATYLNTNSFSATYPLHCNGSDTNNMWRDIGLYYGSSTTIYAIKQNTGETGQATEVGSITSTNTTVYDNVVTIY